jgi:hypothetical protein
MSNPKHPEKSKLDKLASKIGVRGDEPAADPVKGPPSAELEDHLEMIAAAHTDIHNSVHFSAPSPN